MPKISVVMPVYNIKKEWLKEAIESILNQTYSDFEFIIIDDGSTNETPKVLEEYKKKDDRIKVVQGEHRGIANALNKGISEAQGEFIARMDGDDISLPQRFERQIEFMEKNPGVSILGCSILRFPNDKEILYKEKISLLDMLIESPIAHPTAFMRKNDLDKYNLRYDENFKTSEDYDLWSRAIRYLKIANIPDILYKYRNNPSGNSKNKLIAGFDEEIKKNLMNVLTEDVTLQNKTYDVLDRYYPLKLSLKERFFSIKNSWKRGKKYKTLTILGVSIRMYKMVK